MRCSALYSLRTIPSAYYILLHSYRISCFLILKILTVIEYLSWTIGVLDEERRTFAENSR